jgi:hypothetical protein
LIGNNIKVKNFAYSIFEKNNQSRQKSKILATSPKIPEAFVKVDQVISSKIIKKQPLFFLYVG